MRGWYAVDLDGTLARDDDWQGLGHVGAPIPMMANRVKQWLRMGRDVRIFTARVSVHGQALAGGGTVDAVGPIEAWCLEHLGQVLPITNAKDFSTLEMWDDRAVQVVPNTGERVDGLEDAL